MRTMCLIFGCLLVGCQESNPVENVAAVQTTAVTNVPDATQVAASLTKAGLPIGNVAIVTEGNDTNQLLGRPNQYTSKVYFFDGRHPRTEADENENTVEVFANAADAQARYDYVESVTKGVAFAAQYQLLEGPVLVRLDKSVLPSEAEQYRQALKQAVSSR